MKKIFTTSFIFALLVGVAIAQTTQQPPRQPEAGQEEVIRISTSLVQTDVVVTDKNDRILPDLTLSDFEVYENGRKQDLKFMEFVGVDTGRRTEGTLPSLPAAAQPDVAGGFSAKDLKRVVAFVIDDLTVPSEDLPAVRKLLLDFVDNKMRDGDLVAIVRVFGGKGGLQQFTSDRQLLRRAISSITITTHPFTSFNNPAPTRQTGNPSPAGVAPSETGDTGVSPDLNETGIEDISGAGDDVNKLFRGLFALSTANFVIDSLREIPGHKNLVIVSGGIPIFDSGSSGTNYSNFSYMLNRLSDNAIRSGVTVNTLDPRGLRATPGVVGFSETPTRSALASGDPTFGRGGSTAGRVDLPLPPSGLTAPGADDVFGLASNSDHLGLSSVADATGGISVINTNQFEAGLDKVLARGNGYYVLAYTPTEKFDKKFHKIEVRVRRSGVKIFSASGYVAREDSKPGARTKEETIAAAARSPLARRDLDVAPNVAIKPLASRKATVDINMRIDARQLHFTQSADGKYQTAVDIVGFVFDELGKMRGGFSETLNGNLSAEDYKRALVEGIPYTASTELPSGYFQIRAVVREVGSGSMGTFTRFLDVPDLTNGRLAMSSLFLVAVDSAPTKLTALSAVRQLNQKQDLRYASMIYNPKLKDGKPQLRSQVFITQGDRILFREADQPVESGASPVVKVGQLGLSRVPPGRYVLTLVITDPLADKKSQTLSRSVDFTVK